jgi:hypothetical protein
MLVEYSGIEPDNRLRITFAEPDPLQLLLSPKRLAIRYPILKTTGHTTGRLFTH